MAERRSPNKILWLGFFAVAAEAWFAFLEGVMVMVAINNHHYSIYYFGLGLLGLFLGWKAYRLRKLNPDIRGLALAVHILFLVSAVIAFFIGLVFFLFMLWMYPSWSTNQVS